MKQKFDEFRFLLMGYADIALRSEKQLKIELDRVDDLLRKIVEVRKELDTLEKMYSEVITYPHGSA